jgi:hypothetical protein
LRDMPSRAKLTPRHGSGSSGGTSSAGSSTDQAPLRLPAAAAIVAAAAASEMHQWTVERFVWVGAQLLCRGRCCGTSATHRIGTGSPFPGHKRDRTLLPLQQERRSSQHSWIARRKTLGVWWLAPSTMRAFTICQCSEHPSTPGAIVCSYLLHRSWERVGHFSVLLLMISAADARACACVPCVCCSVGLTDTSPEYWQGQGRENVQHLKNSY